MAILGEFWLTVGSQDINRMMDEMMKAAVPTPPTRRRRRTKSSSSNRGGHKDATVPTDKEGSSEKQTAASEPLTEEAKSQSKESESRQIEPEPAKEETPVTEQASEAATTREIPETKESEIAAVAQEPIIETQEESSPAVKEPHEPANDTQEHEVAATGDEKAASTNDTAQEPSEIVTELQESSRDIPPESQDGPSNSDNAPAHDDNSTAEPAIKDQEDQNNKTPSQEPSKPEHSEPAAAPQQDSEDRPGREDKEDATARGVSEDSGVALDSKEDPSTPTVEKRDEAKEPQMEPSGDARREQPDDEAQQEEDTSNTASAQDQSAGEETGVDNSKPQSDEDIAQHASMIEEHATMLEEHVSMLEDHASMLEQHASPVSEPSEAKAPIENDNSETQPEIGIVKGGEAEEYLKMAESAETPSKPEDEPAVVQPASIESDKGDGEVPFSTREISEESQAPQDGHSAEIEQPSTAEKMENEAPALAIDDKRPIDEDATNKSEHVTSDKKEEPNESTDYNLGDKVQAAEELSKSHHDDHGHDREGEELTRDIAQDSQAPQEDQPISIDHHAAASDFDEKRATDDNAIQESSHGTSDDKTESNDAKSSYLGEHSRAVEEPSVNHQDEPATAHVHSEDSSAQQHAPNEAESQVEATSDDSQSQAAPATQEKVEVTEPTHDEEHHQSPVASQSDNAAEVHDELQKQPDQVPSIQDAVVEHEEVQSSGISDANNADASREEPKQESSSHGDSIEQEQVQPREMIASTDTAASREKSQDQAQEPSSSQHEHEQVQSHTQPASTDKVIDQDQPQEQSKQEPSPHDDAVEHETVQSREITEATDTSVGREGSQYQPQQPSIEQEEGKYQEQSASNDTNTSHGDSQEQPALSHDPVEQEEAVPREIVVSSNEIGAQEQSMHEPEIPVRESQDTFGDEQKPSDSDPLHTSPDSVAAVGDTRQEHEVQPEDTHEVLSNERAGQQEQDHPSGDLNSAPSQDITAKSLDDVPPVSTQSQDPDPLVDSHQDQDESSALPSQLDIAPSQEDEKDSISVPDLPQRSRTPVLEEEIHEGAGSGNEPSPSKAGHDPDGSAVHPADETFDLSGNEPIPGTMTHGAEDGDEAREESSLGMGSTPKEDEPVGAANSGMSAVEDLRVEEPNSLDRAEQHDGLSQNVADVQEPDTKAAENIGTVESSAPVQESSAEKSNERDAETGSSQTPQISTALDHTLEDTSNHTASAEPESTAQHDSQSNDRLRIATRNDDPDDGLFAVPVSPRAELNQDKPEQSSDMQQDGHDVTSHENEPSQSDDVHAQEVMSEQIVDRVDQHKGNETASDSHADHDASYQNLYESHSTKANSTDRHDEPDPFVESAAVEGPKDVESVSVNIGSNVESSERGSDERLDPHEDKTAHQTGTENAQTTYADSGLDHEQYGDQSYGQAMPSHIDHDVTSRDIDPESDDEFHYDEKTLDRAVDHSNNPFGAVASQEQERSSAGNPFSLHQDDSKALHDFHASGDNDDRAFEPAPVQDYVPAADHSKWAPSGGYDGEGYGDDNEQAHYQEPDTPSTFSYMATTDPQPSATQSTFTAAGSWDSHTDNGSRAQTATPTDPTFSKPQELYQRPASPEEFKQALHTLPDESAHTVQGTDDLFHDDSEDFDDDDDDESDYGEVPATTTANPTEPFVYQAKGSDSNVSLGGNHSSTSVHRNSVGSHGSWGNHSGSRGSIGHRSTASRGSISSMRETTPVRPTDGAYVSSPTLVRADWAAEHEEELRASSRPSSARPTPQLGPATVHDTPEISPFALRNTPAAAGGEGLSSSRWNPERPSTPPSATRDSAAGGGSPYSAGSYASQQRTPPSAASRASNPFRAQQRTPERQIDPDVFAPRDVTNVPWHARNDSVPASLHSQTTLSSDHSSPVHSALAADRHEPVIRDSWPNPAPAYQQYLASWGAAGGRSRGNSSLSHTNTEDYDPYKADSTGGNNGFGARNAGSNNPFQQGEQISPRILPGPS